MNALWNYFWPMVAIGLVSGTVAGLVAFRRANSLLVAALGAALCLAAAALWHGPAGAADRFAEQVERAARASLDYYEMTQVQGWLQRNPLSRRLLLTGPADDFQTSELVRLMSQLPGVSRATWSPADRGVPLLAEGALAAAAGYLTGLLLAYLVALRRRYNAQWKW